VGRNPLKISDLVEISPCHQQQVPTQISRVVVYKRTPSESSPNPYTDSVVNDKGMVINRQSTLSVKSIDSSEDHQEEGNHPPLRRQRSDNIIS
jgi:hypothetical protein